MDSPKHGDEGGREDTWSADVSFGHLAPVTSLPARREFLTTEQVMEYLGVKASFVRRMCDRGELVFLLLEGRRRFERCDVDAFIDKRKRRSAAAPGRAGRSTRRPDPDDFERWGARRREVRRRARDEEKKGEAGT